MHRSDARRSEARPRQTAEQSPENASVALAGDRQPYAVEVDGQQVTTIEGLASGGILDPIQEAFVSTGAVQCGFCIPGMIVAARQLLASNPNPSRAEVQEGLAGNLCRCGGYSRILDAVVLAASSRR